MPVDLLDAIQLKVAVSAIPASAMRNQGAPGTVAAARKFVSTLALNSFAVKRQAAFVSALDDATDRLCRSLPAQACAWGTSRKALNLFLRDAFYNRFLNDAYGLDVAEEHFEIPLDGVVADALTKLSGGPGLSEWKGVKYLTREQSEEYQSFARIAARQIGIPRVHLDTLLWPAFTRSSSVD